jgi:high-affinity iron transporter
MISFAIIVFREILEVSLILGVLLAATPGLMKRNRWLGIGLGAGILGSLTVALFSQKISDAMEGMGQEVFNATILFLAAFLIGWTVIWMRCHAQMITKELKEVGRAVTQGERPLYTLAIVVALAVLRDGSELVMFTYGSLATGESISSIVGGSLIGLLVGAAVGIGICYGLLKFATRYIFNVTSWMLIFLAAGMVSQAIGFLSAAGYVPELVSPLWDTSRIITEKSLIGGILHTLIGYSERPSGMQMLCYILTITSIGVILKIFGNIKMMQKAISKSAVAAVVVFGIAIFGLPQNAHAAKKVYSPYVVKGDLELEAQGDISFDDDPTVDQTQEQKYGLGYGVTSWWSTEVESELEKEYNDDGEDLDFSLTEMAWENKFQLTEPGQYPVDLGFLLEYAISTEDKHPDALEWKVLLAKDIGKFSHWANLNFEHEVGGGHGNETETGFAWSSRYRLAPYLEPGLEYHAEFGGLHEGKNFNQQEHQVGPAFYGKIGRHVKYDVGYLFGTSTSATDGMLKWIIELEHFF